MEKWKMEHLLKTVDWDSTYLKIALLISEHSKANRRKVGAVIVKNNQIISYGYNGTAPNMNNNCENPDGTTRKDVIHSEVNAIAKCANNGISTRNATIYLTFSPCMNCSLLIIQAGISKVVYMDQHSDTTGVDLIRKIGIEIYQKII